jgi:hypothetical protein
MTTPNNTQPTPRRVFKIGSVRIVEDASMQHLSNEQVQAVLQRTYPEVANATLRVTTEGETSLLEWIPKPGKKG